VGFAYHECTRQVDSYGHVTFSAHHFDPGSRVEHGDDVRHVLDAGRLIQGHATEVLHAQRIVPEEDVLIVDQSVHLIAPTSGRRTNTEFDRGRLIVTSSDGRQMRRVYDRINAQLPRHLLESSLNVCRSERKRTVQNSSNRTAKVFVTYRVCDEDCPLEPERTLLCR
jgi:hypothetical protein